MHIGPVLSYSKDGFKSIEKLQLILKDEPIVNDNSLIIEEIGELTGKTRLIDSDYYFFAV